MESAPIVIVSNRGPVSFHVGDDGEPVARRGSGGLVTGLSVLGDRGDCRWVAAAFTDGDRLVAARGETDAAGFGLRLLDFEPQVWRNHYDVVSNETLWFLHHGLFDVPIEPAFDDRWRQAWIDHRRVNLAFAEAVADAAPTGAVVLAQDYHLTLLGRLLRERRPDLRTIHFHHTPFCSPDEIAMLPDDIADELLDGLAGYDALGFHTPMWASRYEAVASFVGAPQPRRFVAPLGVDAVDISAAAAAPACEREVVRLTELVGDRRFIARVDRIELSKNLLRGFDAYELLLEREPAWRERVVFGAFVYPSREGVPAYARYRQQVEQRVEAINQKWATSGWTPIALETDDDFPRSLAALRINDVLMVNPVRDGLNLVAKEGPIVNDRFGGLVLSNRAGASHELGDCCDLVNPFDVSATASALGAALSRDEESRTALATRRREVALARNPQQWLHDQLASLDGE